MFEHPISNLLNISMTNIKEMIDVNTIIGETIKVDSTVIIPISKMKCSFATGGTDQSSVARDCEKYPFGGATGGNVNISPIAFLVVQENDVKLLHLEDDIHIYEKLIDQFPEVINSVKQVFSKEKKPSITNLEIIERK